MSTCSQVTLRDEISLCGVVRSPQNHLTMPRNDAQKAWFSRNREKQREYDRKYRLKNKEKILEKHRIADAIRGYSRKRYQSKREIYIAQNKAYRKTEKGIAVMAQCNSKRRAALRIGEVTPDQLLELFRSADYCHYCRRLFSESLKKTLDHKTPLSRGGLHELSNLTIACGPCNYSKSSKTESEFFHHYPR